MASTIIIYEGDGSRVNFNIPFDYLKKKFVTVSLGSTRLTGGDYGDTGADYYFLDKTTVRLKIPPATGETLTIRRYTSATERVVTFKDASILKATDLDTSQVQAFHVAEEGRDILEDSLAVNRDGNWDAKNKRIVNLADPVDDTDAVNLAYYKKDADKVQANRDEVVKLHGEVTEMHNNVTELESSAKESAASAKASAGTAVSAQSAVEIMHKSVEDLHSSTQTLEANAKASEANAKASEVNAKASEETVLESEKVVVAAKDQIDTQYKDIIERSDRVEEIGGALEPIAPEIKIVADNIDHVVTDSTNIDDIRLVAGDLEGSFSVDVNEDYGYIEDETPLPTITGGNIKIVADNIDDVNTVAGLAPDFKAAINAVETVSALTARAEQGAVTSEAQARVATTAATNASSSSSLAKDWAVKLDATVDGTDYSAKYWANKAKADGVAKVEEAVTAGIASVNSSRDAAIKSITDEGSSQVSKVTAEGTKQVNAVTDAGAAQTTKVTTEGNKQVARVTAEGDKQVGLVATANATMDAKVTAATQQATLAQTYATEAEDSANDAFAKATEASTSATNAKNSATSAQTSATTASAQATASRTSADEAKLAKDAAEKAQGNASTSATSAASSATKAQQSAEEAKGYAEQASSGQLQADWNETDSTAKSFIKNKPTIPVVDVTKSYVDTQLATKANQTVVDTKAEKSYVDTQLATKTDKSYVDGTIDYGYI